MEGLFALWLEWPTTFVLFPSWSSLWEHAEVPGKLTYKIWRSSVYYYLSQPALGITLLVSHSGDRDSKKSRQWSTTVSKSVVWHNENGKWYCINLSYSQYNLRIEIPQQDDPLFSFVLIWTGHWLAVYENSLDNISKWWIPRTPGTCFQEIWFNDECLCSLPKSSLVQWKVKENKLPLGMLFISAVIWRNNASCQSDMSRQGIKYLLFSNSSPCR